MSATATTLTKKTKGPMVNIMKGLLENMEEDNAKTQKLLKEGWVGRLMAESLRRAHKLAMGCGASEESVEYFVAGQLSLKAKHREFFCNITTKEARLVWLKTWCQMKNLY
jgi:hypothetical protein